MVVDEKKNASKRGKKTFKQKSKTKKKTINDYFIMSKPVGDYEGWCLDDGEVVIKMNDDR